MGQHAAVESASARRRMISRDMGVAVKSVSAKRASRRGGARGRIMRLYERLAEEQDPARRAMIDAQLFALDRGYRHRPPVQSDGS